MTTDMRVFEDSDVEGTRRDERSENTLNSHCDPCTRLSGTESEIRDWRLRGEICFVFAARAVGVPSHVPSFGVLCRTVHCHKQVSASLTASECCSLGLR